ncbi:MAG: hypothetical protein ACQ9MH_02765 [Nitrospinales bacterium]
MRAGKIIFVVIMILGLATPAMAQQLVIGGKGNLNTGMQLKDAFKTMGYPDAFIVKRGPSSNFDHIEMPYATLGVVIRAMSNGKIIEAIDIKPSFKGSFDTGVKLGDPFTTLVAKYGTPESLSSQIARYPVKGMYFLMSNSNLLSAKLFSQNTKLLEHKMVKP